MSVIPPSPDYLRPPPPRLPPPGTSWLLPDLPINLNLWLKGSVGLSGGIRITLAAGIYVDVMAISFWGTARDCEWRYYGRSRGGGGGGAPGNGSGRQVPRQSDQCPPPPPPPPPPPKLLASRRPPHQHWTLSKQTYTHYGYSILNASCFLSFSAHDNSVWNTSQRCMERWGRDKYSQSSGWWDLWRTSRLFTLVTYAGRLNG